MQRVSVPSTRASEDRRVTEETTESHIQKTEAASLQDRKTAVIAEIIRRHVTHPIASALVVGCGSGVEAAVLGIRVVGIDIKGVFDPRAAQVVDLRQGDATQLDFPDKSFDLVYSYHALEHIPDYQQALREMRRVLRTPGSFCIGTPNRARLIGYLGSKEATFSQKIQWNLIDWKARLRGRFRNEYGAHAGFTKKELAAALDTTLGTSRDITLEYYLTLYRRRAGFVRTLHRSGISALLLPSVYFIGSLPVAATIAADVSAREELLPQPKKSIA